MARKAKAVVVSEVVATVVAEEVIAQEVVEAVEVVEEVVETSLLASLLEAPLPTPIAEVVEDKPKQVKNQGVGKYVRELIADGLTNTEILKKVHAEYDNTNTTYACVAWYRNKMKKTNQVISTSKAVEVVEKFLSDEPADVNDDELETEDELLQMVGQ